MVPQTIAEIQFDNLQEGTEVVFKLQHGLSSEKNFLADKDWIKFNARQLEALEKRFKAGENIDDLLNEASIEDSHWRWLTKGRILNSSEYEWFYLISDCSVEGICVVCHPTTSRIDTKNIFYIDYLATAPWNRDNLVSKKVYKGVGTALIEQSLRYSVDVLKYRPGFGLHSLPKAVPYYEKIGMQSFGEDKEKDSMLYFEMNSETSATLL
jgi:hypothetical protein